MDLQPIFKLSLLGVFCLISIILSVIVNSKNRQEVIPHISIFITLTILTLLLPTN